MSDPYPRISEVQTQTQLGLGANHIKLLWVRFRVSTVYQESWVSAFEMLDPFGPATKGDFSFKSNFVELSCFYCVC